MADVPSDLLEFSTVLLAPGIQPGVVDSSDLPLLGEAMASASVRTPILAAYRFPAHVVQIEDPKVQFSAPEPTKESVDRLTAAVTAFIDDFIGRRGLTAVGHNVKFRRRPDSGLLPQEYFRLIVNDQALHSLDTTKAAEAELDVTFWPPWCSRARVRVEPSRVDDLNAIYMSFNYHFDLAGEDARKQLDIALGAVNDVIDSAESACSRLLSLQPSGGESGT